MKLLYVEDKGREGFQEQGEVLKWSRDAEEEQAIE
jgi:hypothetical protein